jgi:hypothetical protein
MKRTELRLPDDIYEQLRTVAFTERKSLNQIIVDASAYYLINYDMGRIPGQKRASQN